MRIMPGGALEADKDLSGPSSIFVGRKLDEHRGAFLLEYPMDKGAVVEGSWDAMEQLWEVSFHFWIDFRCIPLPLFDKQSASAFVSLPCLEPSCYGPYLTIPSMCTPKTI